MSREAAPEDGGLTGFPRVSGDEPAKDTAGRPLFAFSPRERG